MYFFVIFYYLLSFNLNYVLYCICCFVLYFIHRHNIIKNTAIAVYLVVSFLYQNVAVLKYKYFENNINSELIDSNGR